MGLLPKPAHTVRPKTQCYALSWVLQAQQNLRHQLTEHETGTHTTMYSSEPLVSDTLKYLQSLSKQESSASFQEIFLKEM